MAVVLRNGWKAFDEWVIGKMDHRSDDWFLMGSLWYLITVVVLYLYFVKYLGPMLMKNRPAFKLEGTLKVYNLCQVALNIYMLYHCLDAGWAFEYKWLCEPVDYSSTPSALYALKGVWMYMMLKVLDFMDTVFIILRKKNSQATFLHITHHIGMFIISWIGTKYLPGGHMTLIGPVNSFIHAVMYAYYFITAAWPEYKSRLWWKKHLTQMQMVQFIIIFVHSFSLIFMDETCAYPWIFGLLFGTLSAVMFLLFLEFYMKAYGKKTS